MCKSLSIRGSDNKRICLTACKQIPPKNFPFRFSIVNQYAYVRYIVISDNNIYSTKTSI